MTKLALFIFIGAAAPSVLVGRVSAALGRSSAGGTDRGCGMGWDVAILLILGTSLALASLAWFLVGSLMNEQQYATPRPKPNEGIEPPSSKYEARPMTYISPMDGRQRIVIWTVPGAPYE
jgi:hypothetical protein